eukprot:15468581-Alexandrium_andersonii.AAC.1
MLRLAKDPVPFGLGGRILSLSWGLQVGHGAQAAPEHFDGVGRLHRRFVRTAIKPVEVLRGPAHAPAGVRQCDSNSVCVCVCVCACVCVSRRVCLRGWVGLRLSVGLLACSLDSVLAGWLSNFV